MGTRIRLIAVLGLLACTPRPETDWPAELAWPTAHVAGQQQEPAPPQSQAVRVRIAVFNASLHRERAGMLREQLAKGDPQAHAIAEIVQRVAPDILLIAEIDEDAEAIALFRDRYLAVPHGDTEGLRLPHAMQPRCNTGVASNLDLDRDGKVGGAGDAWGFGAYPGQFCFALVSRWPIANDEVRSFSTLRWAQMPGHLMPPGFWPDEIAQQVRLSSKSHVDVPIDVEGTRLHVLAHHPTPPVFDGPEDRNGRRNHDEIRLWADYLSGPDARWIVDDAGTAGGLAARELFVILGDHNADPDDGDSFPHAIAQLLDHPRVEPGAVPTSRGAVLAAMAQHGANDAQQGDPARDTADFDDRTTGNLRVDYVLPARGMRTTGAGVFWPATDEPYAELVRASDHRLVWVDVWVAPAAP
jgi:endonuclease/exonuclease/phosphatase family protein